ncbi:cupin domain-containing protein [Prosthecobacter debontii]|uniref:cupin domain-containing protein n=1 Tax=Prosthecobacter debontii TaxID=48467 RepID=UPI00099B0446|nr:cupin domain-containing protein [Prosthecobacter debontii]
MNPAACLISSWADLPAHNVLGVEVAILTGGAETQGAMASYHARCVPGAGAPPHLHRDADEAFFVLEGEFEILCGEETRKAVPGDHVFIPRGVVHAFKGVSEQPARLLGMCTPAGHENFFRDAADLAASGEMNPDSITALCERHHIELIHG